VFRLISTFSGTELAQTAVLTVQPALPVHARESHVEMLKCDCSLFFGNTANMTKKKDDSSRETVKAVIVAAINAAGGKLATEVAGPLCKKHTSKKLKEIFNSDSTFVKIKESGKTFICLQNARVPVVQSAGVPAVMKPAVVNTINNLIDNIGGNICSISAGTQIPQNIVTTAENSQPLTPLMYQIIGPISSPHDPRFKDMLQLLQNTPVLALDCEWSGKQICLLQLAALGIGSGGTQICAVYLLDMAAAPSTAGPSSLSSESQASMMLKPLRPVLEDKRILKVLHDAREVSPVS